MTSIDPGILHLEIETPPDGLVNLVSNPDGALGAWGWLTPVANTNLTSSTYYDDGAPLSQLTFKTTVSQAAYLTTEPISATPSTWYGARLDLASITASHTIRLRFEWLDASQALLSSSTQTVGYSTAGTVFLGPYQAPTGTAFVRLRIDLYSGTGTTNPAANALVTFTYAMVTTLASATAVQTRTNLWTNPSFETNLTGVTNGGDGTLSRDSGVSMFGTYSAKWTGVDAKFALTFRNTATLTAGEVYTVSFYARASAAQRIRMQRDAVTVGGVAAFGRTAYVALTTAWQRYSMTFTAADSATFSYLFFDTSSGTATGNIYFDGFQLEKANAATDYFDGSQAATSDWTYFWSGTAHASTSIAQSPAGQFDYAAPVQWFDIISPTSTIAITRPQLDLGTLNATIISEDLDPATASTISDGKAVRLRVDGMTRPLFTGKVVQATVAYDFTRVDETRRTTITLTVDDNMNTLAQHSRTFGVGTIAELPYVLEGAGVPWNCNGSGNQVPSATVTSYNDQATAVDQVALTRDSVLGYAWVDTSGVLQAWDRDQISTTLAATLTEADYNDDIVIDYDTEHVIDNVLIQLMTYDEANGASEQTNLGPYIAAGTSGQHQQTFTVNGLTTDQCATLAADILAANSAPTRIVESLTVTMTAENIATFAGLDHYDLVNVVCERAGINANLRVIEIGHEIDAVQQHGTVQVSWVMTLKFTSDGTVATPQLLPDPTAVQLKNLPSGVAYTPTWTANTTNPSIGNGTLAAQYHLDDGWCDFWIELTIGSTTNLGAGTWQFTLPVDPADRHWFFSEGEAFDSSANASYFAGLALTTTTSSTVAGRSIQSGTAGQYIGINSTVPFAWAAGDVLMISGRYQVG